MPVPEIDFDDMAINLLPSDQRKPFWIISAQALISQVVRLYGLFKGYMSGEVFAAYDPIETYLIGAKVQYNFKTYESLASGNSGNQPDISPLAWILRNNSFIGATERVKYNGRYLELTYALNRYFNEQLTTNGFVGFRQPPYPAPYDYGLGGGVFSDIYITNVEPVYTSFVMFPNAQSSSNMFPATSSQFMFPVPVYSGVSTYLFAINIPLSVYNSLGATDIIRTAIVSAFVNQYKVSGTSFTINTY